ncbi:MAG: hypothetical protein ACRDIU_04160, partial [Actinomycetota bacterium]
KPRFPITGGGGSDSEYQMGLVQVDVFTGSDDIGSMIAGGLVTGAVLVFTLLSGIVVASLGGMHAANAVSDRGGAVASGLLAGLVGHIVMVAALGAVLLVGMDVLKARNEPSAAGEPAVESTVDPDCAETFGPDSPICRAGPNAEKAPEQGSDEDNGIDIDQLMKVALGAVPAGLVGASTAGILFSRRKL